MYYVYSKYLGNGREDFINTYETEKDAVLKVASCYKIDERIGQKGEYYYFVKKH